MPSAPGATYSGQIRIQILYATPTPLLVDHSPTGAGRGHRLMIEGHSWSVRLNPATKVKTLYRSIACSAAVTFKGPIQRSFGADM